MIADKNFKFKTNVSFDYYEKKTDATACLSRAGADAIQKEKMAFFEQDVTVPQFLSLATSGHTFCNLFDYDPNQQYWVSFSTGNHLTDPEYKKGKHKGGMKLCMKADQFFKGSQAVFIDIDKTKYTTVPEYLAQLRYKPTCVYMSYSDSLLKHGIASRRFRMVYVFDRILGKEELQYVSQAITDCIVIDTAEPMEDDCGTRISQYMNGVWGNNETYETDLIYSISDFPKIDYGISIQVPVANSNQVSFNEVMLNDMATMSYQDFMHYYSWQYQYKYRIERDEWVNETYQLTEPGYLQLWFYREKQVDGQKRRRKLSFNAFLRRLMFPDMDADTLLFNLYVDYNRFFDNSDGIITLDTLKRKVVNAMNMTTEQLLAICDSYIKYWDVHRPKFIFKSGIYTTPALINFTAKEVRWHELDLVYDRSKSIKENSLIITDVCLATLYNYCSERGIETQPGQVSLRQQRKNKKYEKQEKIVLFQKLYNPSLTERENLEVLKGNGLIMSESTIHEWKSRYYQEKPEFDHPSIQIPFPEFKMPDLNILEDDVVCEWDKPVNPITGCLGECTSWQFPQFNWNF